jgi:hypothetical protein
MLVKNLTFRGTYSLDNTFVSQGGQYDDGSAIVKYIYPDGRIQYRNTAGANQFDYVVPNGLQDLMLFRMGRPGESNSINCS